MELPIFQVDAFASKTFEGNPAAVVPLEEWLDDSVMQAIAAENNLAETAFFVPTEEGFHLRWFTPSTEVPLCGHATLASSHVIFNELGYDQDTIHFQTKSGVLSVKRKGDGLSMDFPASPPKPSTIPEGLEDALGGIKLLEAHESGFLLVVASDEKAVESTQVDHAALAKIAPGDFILTAKSKTYDFVSRCFAPAMGIDEDPVTGAAHCVSVPFWADRLGKNVLHARQVSKRGGDLICTLDGDRVELFGKAAQFLTGTIYV